MNSRSLYLILLFILIPQVHYAQKQIPLFTVFGCYAIPSGDLGDMDINNASAGFANNGFGAGVDLNITKQAEGNSLSFVISAAYISNSIDKQKVQDGLINAITGIESRLQYDASVTSDSWKSIPVMVGLKVCVRESPSVGSYFVMLVGWNFVQEIYQKVIINTSFYDENNRYNTMKLTARATSNVSPQFGLTLGGGLLILDRVNLGFRYYILGKPEIKTKYRLGSILNTPDGVYNNGDRGTETWEMSMSIFMLTFGITL